MKLSLDKASWIAIGTRTGWLKSAQSEESWFPQAWGRKVKLLAEPYLTQGAMAHPEGKIPWTGSMGEILTRMHANLGVTPLTLSKIIPFLGGRGAVTPATFLNEAGTVLLNRITTLSQAFDLLMKFKTVSNDPASFRNMRKAFLDFLEHKFGEVPDPSHVDLSELIEFLRHQKQALNEAWGDILALL